MVMIGEPIVEELDDDFGYSRRTSSTGRTSVEWTQSYLVRVNPENTIMDVKGWANLNLPATFDSKPRRTFELDEDGLINPGEYKFLLSFKTPDGEDEDEETAINPYVAVDCVQGRIKLKYSYETVEDFQRNGTDEANYYDFNQAINASDNGIEGAEIISPSFIWTETWVLPKTIATWSYLRATAKLRGKTNIASFRGMEPESVLFHGIRSRQKDKHNMEVVFKFEHGEHEELNNAQFPHFSSVVGFVKKAHDYIWQVIKKFKEGNRMVSQPAYIAVEKVYKTTDFTAMQIGTDLPETANILP